MRSIVRKPFGSWRRFGRASVLVATFCFLAGCFELNLPDGPDRITVLSLLDGAEIDLTGKLKAFFETK